MKPTNLEESGCNPISSNCVIWQGPDLGCINLCKGDTVSGVVHKLATELCTLLDMFKVENYELDCLALGVCAPEDFAALIQLIITKVCEENEIPVGEAAGGCPDCVVPIAECFYYQSPQGDTLTTMQLQDYVLAIGNQICLLAGSIGTINATLDSHNIRISALENAGLPTFNLPTITPTCVLPSVPTDLDEVMTALEEQFCNLRQFTGDTTSISVALQAACVGLNNSTRLQGSGPMSSIAGWNIAPQNLAQSFSNLWKTVCDMRSAIQFIQANCCDTGCSAIDLQVSATLTSSTVLRLIFSGTIPANYVDANPASTVILTDAAAGGPQTINNVNIKNNYFDLSQPYDINLSGVDGALDVTANITLRLVDPVTGDTCQSIIEVTALGADTCPTLVLNSGYDNVDYSFTWNGTLPKIVTMELYDALGVTLIQSSPLSITTTSPSGSFVNLSQGTGYKIRIVIDGTPCEFQDIATLSFSCAAPTLLSPDFSYVDPQGDTTGSTIEAWILEYITLNP